MVSAPMYLGARLVAHSHATRGPDVPGFVVPQLELVYDINNPGISLWKHHTQHHSSSFPSRLRRQPKVRLVVEPSDDYQVRMPHSPPYQYAYPPSSS
ncbi:hypothetical protein C8Q77DRAFT_750713 [Trametes polyzona]|nr:hypothetical protein C8Q77DRAFT_750713 [Trametes polyzona]